MASWGGLPIEILYCILCQLTHPTDLSTCLTVCKNWHKAAQEIVYNTVELSRPSQITRFAECIVRARRVGGPGLLVKKISVFGDVGSSSAVCLEDCLSDILRCCNHIKTIETIGFNPGITFFTHIMQQLDQGNCLLLENIPFPSIKDEDIRAYGYASWVLRDRLTCLMISDRAEHNIHLGLSESGLKSFPRLKYLMYYLKDAESLYKMDTMIKNVTSLQLVEINQHRRTSTLDHGMDLTSRKPCTQVEGFIGSGIMMPSNKMLKYIMATFPKLRLLNLAFAMISLKSQLSLENSLSTEACVEFLSSAYKKIYTLNIEQLYVENAVGVASSFLDQVKFDGILGIHYENDHNHPQYINLTRSKFTVQCVQPVNALYTVLPHRELIQKFGRDLVGVSLDFGDAYTLYQELNHRELHRNDVHGYCLDYLFKYCLHLESLELANFLFTRCNPEFTLCNTLQVLIFDCCEFSNTALQELSERIPSLTLLCILDSDFEYDSIWDLPIYTTSVTAIHWKDTGHEDSRDDYSEFHLRLEKGARTLFYTGNKHRVYPCSDNGDAYHKTFDVDDILHIHVACKHIEYFHLDIPNIKMLIMHPGDTNQAIFVHPSLQYHQEVNRIMENKLDV